MVVVVVGEAATGAEFFPVLHTIQMDREAKLNPTFSVGPHSGLRPFLGIYFFLGTSHQRKSGDLETKDYREEGDRVK